MINSLAITICTKDREQVLSDAFVAAIASICDANRQPDCEILIIDDGDLQKEIIAEFSSIALHNEVTFKYYKKSGSQQRGLYGSRRLAVDLLETSHVLFIDDDCLLGPNYVAKVFEHFEDNTIVGLTGVDHKNIPKADERVRTLWKLFFLADETGQLSITGFNHGHSYWLERDNPFASNFVHGCNMTFELSAIRHLPECPWLTGHSICEDLVIAHTAKRSGTILVDPTLPFLHLETPGGRGATISRLKRKLSSHWHFHKLRSLRGPNDILFAWSAIGYLTHCAVKIAHARL